jgi:hypothetical protein
MPMLIFHRPSSNLERQVPKSYSDCKYHSFVRERGFMNSHMFQEISLDLSDRPIFRMRALHGDLNSSTAYQDNETNVINVYSVYYKLEASPCFEHYLLIFRRRCSNGTWYIACVICQSAAPGAANNTDLFLIG